MRVNKDWNSQHKKTAQNLFSQEIGNRQTASFFETGLEALQSISESSSSPWIPYAPGELKKESLKDLENLYGSISEEGKDPEKTITDIISKFLPGAPHWRNPNLQYNICAPTNSVSNAILGIAQEINIHNISTDFSGRCLSAEGAISKIMASLVDLPSENVRGLFTFGGTGSNMYAMKLAINKAFSGAGKFGVPNNIYFLLTSDAHFSHKTIADWLGIGIDKALQIKSDSENRSSVDDAEGKARSILEKGGILAGFFLNGGPFYDFVIDDIQSFVGLREKLVMEYKLNYIPHIHVDSVIGWIWLMFNNYDFSNNPLDIPQKSLSLIEKQFQRVYQIRLADSWGVDFHKGLGGCPTPCGLFVSNKRNELLSLSKSKRGIDTHHLGNDWSEEDPSDITLETSRAAGSALAALGSLTVMGRNGFRRFLANQIDTTLYFRGIISKTKQFIVGNPHSLGFNTMLVAIPESFSGKIKNWSVFMTEVEKNKELLEECNRNIKNFYELCLPRDNSNLHRLGCSFSRSFKKTSDGRPISGLKYCFVSPHMSYDTVDKEVGN